ncbi:MAG: hypothetical protein WBX15_19630 [Thermoanaerobaculia bacterium]
MRALRALSIALLGVVVAIPARAGFDEIAREIGSIPRVTRTGIPFMGLGRIAIRIMHPDGVHDVKLATFENVPATRDVVAIARRLAGPEWQPIVVASSRRDGERTVVFAAPAGSLVRMLIVSQDSDETTVVELKSDPDVLMSPDRMTRSGK